MIRLLYIANMRLPTEKAHGLQIMQNCEALADAGATVELWVARRFNSPAMRAIADSWDYYGVRHNFRVRRLPTLDLMPLTGGRANIFTRIVFYLQLWSFVLAVMLRGLWVAADVYYSRDALTILALSLIKPRHKLAYEPHRFATSTSGQRLQKLVVRRAGSIFPITPRLRGDLLLLAGDEIANRTQVLHDGVRRERFDDPPERSEARQRLGWPDDAFIVGYVGRLHTMLMDKGVGTLVEALQQVPGSALALVGGPEAMAQALREKWLALGLDDASFLYAGHVQSDQVPLYLSAFDVCAMPHPYTRHFAYYTSPLKLFEYMAARRPIVASDLPGWADVVADGETALLVPPGDAVALAGALRRLQNDPDLGNELARRAYDRVMNHYTWEVRARTILKTVSNRASTVTD